MSPVAPVKTFSVLDEPIDLHFEDHAGTVRVIPEDSDLMILSVNEAIEACRAFDQQLQFKRQFDMLINTLGAWLQARKDRIAEAFVTTRDAGLLLLIVTKAPKYDTQFESDVTDLDIQIANDSDYKLIDLSVLALPKCPQESVYSFLSRQMRLRYVIEDGDGK